MSATATPLPRLNQRLEVAVGDRGTAQYFSRLVEETADTLRIALPEMEGTAMHVAEGDALRVWYTQSGSYWCLHTLARTVYQRDGETLIEVDRHGDVHRAQRRNHVRVDVSLLLHATVETRAPQASEAIAVGAEDLSAQEGELKGSKTRVGAHSGQSEVDETAPDPRVTGARISGVTRNISGGGVSFRSPVRLVREDRLSLTFYLPELDGEITSRARVVHAHADPEKDGQYVIACTFDRMAITDRERIIRFLFFRQRELAGRRKVGVR